jgi:hypothetical protein
VGGGNLNNATTKNATVGGGSQNTAGFSATVSGGFLNVASGATAAIGGGSLNTASGSFSTVPGGRRARATNDGAFVWSGNDTVETVSTNSHSFTVRASGGVRFITTTATNNLNVTNVGGLNGVALRPGGTAWVTLSDSNAKTAVQAVDPRAVLAKLEHLPVTEWEYRHDPQRRYFGPMAQDFHTAFGLGDDDKTINTLDADGVLFLSVKGLLEEVRLRDRRVAQLEAWSREQVAASEAEIEELKAELRALRDEVRSTLPPAR